MILFFEDFFHAGVFFTREFIWGKSLFHAEVAGEQRVHAELISRKVAACGSFAKEQRAQRVNVTQSRCLRQLRTEAKSAKRQ